MDFALVGQKRKNNISRFRGWSKLIIIFSFLTNREILKKKGK
jgi:hypothetical protein